MAAGNCSGDAVLIGFGEYVEVGVGVGAGFVMSTWPTSG